MPFFRWLNHRLHEREQGAGEPLLILPGNTASSAFHSGELDYFGQHYHPTASLYSASRRETTTPH